MLSAKHHCVVTHPDVDRALYEWQMGMEAKGETVTGAMLVEKQKKFEALFDVPENKQLAGEG